MEDTAATTRRIETTSGPAETEALARALARGTAPNGVVLLSGPVGAGKSVFARAFIRELCGEGTTVPSPTFTLVQTYESAKGPLAHFDLYRLAGPEEMRDIGWEEALADGIVLCEWPERLGPYTPDNAVRVRIEPRGETERSIEIHAG